MQNQYNLIDDLGFQQMPAEAYEKWLGSLNQTQNKQENEKIQENLKQSTKSLNEANRKMINKN